MISLLTCIDEDSRYARGFPSLVKLAQKLGPLRPAKNVLLLSEMS
jgi:hypothetical protein